MRIAITGGTGFIGQKLVQVLLEKGHNCVVLSRSTTTSSSPSLKYVRCDYTAGGDWEPEVQSCDALIHLAGKSVADCRWTEAAKKEIWESRTLTTHALVHSISKQGSKCRSFICASAVGFYGDTGAKKVDEKAEPGSDFLAKVCQEWEREALLAQEKGIRVAIGRIGVVLSPEGGALAKMLLPFKFFVGGPIGSGRQYMPWIHREDVARIFAFLAENETASGIFNATAPKPVTMSEFAKTLGNVLHRPALFPVPEFVIKIMLGEAAAIVLQGQNTSSDKIINAGFQFQFPELATALKNLI